MLTLLLVLQFVVVVSLILAVSLQQSSSDGVSGLAGGGHGIVSSKASANFITKTTFILAFVFMINSLCLAKLTIMDLQKSGKIIESIKEAVNQDPVVPISQ
ncbi:MAG: preprotein translocase subunit SecG [Candidatus Midichloria mitochondrii]|uniref:Protein-export membrane protein SecG n=1 Tax=Midichloria mitochondrii (strain IricVA) TaxID=696127 RepID=F7XWF4_MIDMI|nr:preprotein translocase subunit SecG [Candidatus Midichloria mitochondrii]AEI89003.1 preprotein translocase subunit SecG [Candidatus Midichloria mitochondrii IricVA]MDJ1256732.1 preprotein translocase subunit SecG [Candidatus Midichloria mitochondrii]MDJ1288435.1 preprotein translocase subunit SecG [Candidatus Midichloria mitochondrii]MDJ1299270.1 preprotein translocase subunit SecG [Candidatus Midichloria mitochondrii]MDJ1312800.1 preprotein translocase subunit SecG [Candidatus Midichloria 